MNYFSFSFSLILVSKKIALIENISVNEMNTAAHVHCKLLLQFGHSTTYRHLVVWTIYVSKMILCCVDRDIFKQM